MMHAYDCICKFRAYVHIHRGKQKKTAADMKCQQNSTLAKKLQLTGNRVTAADPRHQALVKQGSSAGLGRRLKLH